MAELLRTGRKVGRTIYVQHGLLPADDDPLVGVMDTEVLASRIVDAVNGAALHTVQELNEAREQGRAEGREQGSAAALVAREDAASPDVAAVAEQYRVLWGYNEVNDSCRKAAVQAVQMVKLAAPAKPTEAPDVQRAAPTRDVYVRLVDGGVDSTTAPVYNVRIDWTCTPNGRWVPVGVEVLGASGVEIDGELVLRGGGADGGGEDEGRGTDSINAGTDGIAVSTGACSVCGDQHELVIGAHEDLKRRTWECQGTGERPRRSDLPWSMTHPMDFADDDGPTQSEVDDLRWESRIDRKVGELAEAAGIDRDGLDWEEVLDGGIAAIRTGREPEVVNGQDVPSLPHGSVVIYTDSDNSYQVVAGKVYTPGVQGAVGGLRGGPHFRLLHRGSAPEVFETPLQLGDVVAGDRAVTAPIDTTLRCTTAAVVALRTVNGWSLTGWAAESDPEHHVRVNTWRVVEVGEGRGES